MTDDDDDTFRRANYARLFGATPEAEAEREAEAREMEERQAQIKRDEVMEWCRQRAEAREAETSRRREVPYDGAGQPLPVVTKAYSAPAASAAAATDWAPYIKRAIKKASDASDEAMAKAIAQSIGKDLIAVERRCDALQKDVARLTAELAELRALRSQPTTVDEERKRAGEIRRQRQELDRLRVA